jgi:hypothetical protein
MNKKTIVTIACCALIAPLAIAKETKQKKHTTGYIEQGVTVTGASVTTIEAGAAASYQPRGSLVVNYTGAGRYVLEDRASVQSSNGQVAQLPVKPGTPVRVYFTNTDGIKTIDRVVVD